MTRRAAPAAALALLAAALPVRAQTSRSAPPETWLFKWFVYPAYNSLEKVSGNVALSYRLPPRRGPEPATGGFELTGRISSAGTRAAQLAADFPGLWRRWRLLAIVAAERANRAPYYGLGNDTELDDSAEAANGDVFYHRYRLIRTTGFLAAQRDLTPRVRLHLGLQARHYRARANEGATRLGEDIAAGVVGDTGSTGGVELRTGILYDTRDEEATPSRGVFLEALVGRGVAGTVGSFSYTRWAFGAREFVPLGEFTTLGLRQQVELAGGGMPFFIAYERLTSWRPDEGFGGGTTLRANLPGRWLAPNRMLASVDLRYKKYDIPFPRSPVRFWLVAFTDVGVVWDRGQQPDLGGLHGGVGGGFRLQYSKGGLFGIDLGWSPDARFEFATAFQFAY